MHVYVYLYVNLYIHTYTYITHIKIKFSMDLKFLLITLKYDICLYLFTYDFFNLKTNFIFHFLFNIYINNHFWTPNLVCILYKILTLWKQTCLSLIHVTITFFIIVFLNHSIKFVSHFINLSIFILFSTIHLFLIK